MRYPRPIGNLILAAASLFGADVSFHLREGRPIVDGVFVNGHGPFRFLLDTGAQSNQMDIRLARKIGLRATFRVEMATMAGVAQMAGTGGVRMRLGAAEAVSTEILFSSMEAIHQLTTEIQGVVGQAFLANFDYLLDLRGRRIVFGTQERKGLRAGLILAAERPAVWTSLGLLAIDSGADRLILFGAGPSGGGNLRTATGVTRAVPARGSPLFIAGRRVRTAGAIIVTPAGVQTEDGLLPAAIFKSIYFCHSKGYLIFE
jgi:hypothetical protein